jgi:peptidoglycan/LPS O-acetylase OafA/YrhL
LGQAGVLAFFVHTSLVLMQSLERMQSAHPDFRRLAMSFYVRRFFRIYPLAIAVIVAVLVLGLPAMTWRETPPITTKVVVANVLLVQNLISGQSVLGPLWSLPYEVQMYVLLPVLYLLARKAQGPRLLVALIAFFAVGAHVVAQYTGGRLNMLAYVPCFLSGVLCYALSRRVEARWPAVAWIPFVLLLVTGYCLSQMNDVAPVYWKGWIFCVILGLAVPRFVDCQAPGTNRVAAELAKYSYGLYLLHVPMLHLVYDVIRPQNLALGIVVYFVLTALAALAAFHLLEQPFMDWGRRLTDRPDRAAADPASPSAQDVRDSVVAPGRP